MTRREISFVPAVAIIVAHETQQTITTPKTEKKMQRHDLVLRSDDRDREAWPSATDFELRIPYALRGVQSLSLVWVRTEPPTQGSFLLHVGDDTERIFDSGGALALVEAGGGQLSGTAQEVHFWPCPTMDRVRVRAVASEADPKQEDLFRSISLAVRVNSN